MVRLTMQPRWKRYAFFYAQAQYHSPCGSSIISIQSNIFFIKFTSVKIPTAATQIASYAIGGLGPDFTGCSNCTASCVAFIKLIDPLLNIHRYPLEEEYVYSAHKADSCWR